jgi:N-acetylmuramoyl-L-alanine amidase
LGIRKIVIDPGHGGRDPGAIAPNGLKEKDIVLAVSKKLATLLRTRLGAEVVLTRTTDAFIPLEERTAIANTEKGDLFISVHVNSAPSPRLLGVETYVLNLTNDEDSMRLAALENATSASKMSDLQNILADLLNNTKLDESTKLAEHVQTKMAQGLRIKDLGVKQAPFYVLIGAQMPAILSEITFLSNPGEAQRLRQDYYLKTIAEHISAGVNEYIRGSNLAMISP